MTPRGGLGCNNGILHILHNDKLFSDNEGLLYLQGTPRVRVQMQEEMSWCSEDAGKPDRSQSRLVK